jgi:hypothetical protein
MMFSDCVSVPVEPAEPVQAVEPAEPAQAVEPAEPAQAVEPAEPAKKRVTKGGKVETAAKLALKQKNAAKKTVEYRKSQRKKLIRKNTICRAHLRFRDFVFSMVDKSATRNLATVHMLASAEKEIALLSKAFHKIEA